ncbi:nucleotidyltransferase domain-containing protein [Lactococcus lactis subsp. lactis]|uniref:nucleotidyltransferase family protein n=1 Tax=Lactococcus TaxID=1357 RepID=UPI001CDC915F|nr:MULTISPECIES: nucleotidyltransferase domain-containing protein [Lactococcus]MCA2390549.1 nucleotidyltransferase domain-containing protein [Lactococcus sp. NH2-7C]WGV29759.1 nucleotidyltransferase domain-containing protein [Lactococcus sp. NH2-7C]WKB48592.1 nucleotidyltransferase domain-containing protein [Lactococcus lactis subsp. lactis]
MSVLSMKEIVEKIRPIIKEYQIPEVWIFGSYARNEASENSDIDLVVNSSDIDDYAFLFDLEEKIEKVLNRSVDIIEEETLYNKRTPQRERFNTSVRNEMFKLI